MVLCPQFRLTVCLRVYQEHGYGLNLPAKARIMLVLVRITHQKSAVVWPVLSGSRQIE